MDRVLITWVVEEESTRNEEEQEAGGSSAERERIEAASDKEPAAVGDRRVPRLLHHTQKKSLHIFSWLIGTLLTASLQEATVAPCAPSENGRPDRPIASFRIFFCPC